MADYKIQALKPNLYLIRWLRSVELRAESEKQFLQEIGSLLHTATEPIYFITDLRHGKISNALILREMGLLTKHNKWGGSTAFSQDPVTNLMVAVFSQYARRELKGARNETWESAEDAIAYLDRLEPGLCDGVDWAAALA